MSYCPHMVGPAIITGVSRCIGATRARQSAVAGDDVCISYVTHFQAAGRVIAKCEALAQKAVPMKADGGNTRDVAELVDACGNALGPVSFLVNNAGIIGKAAVETFTIGLVKEIGIHKPSGDTGQPAMSPLGRVASADDVAVGILWLASPRPGYVMEAVLPDSGGL